MEKVKRIEIIVDESLTSLGGRDYGESLYREYIEKELDLTSDFRYVLVFPEYVDSVAIGFVKGMVCEIQSELQDEDFFERFEVEGNKECIKDFKGAVAY